MSDHISDTLDFSDKGKASIHSSIRELSVTPASGSTSVTLQQSGTVNSKFYFGSQPHYKGKYSSIRGVLSVPSQGGLEYSVLHTQPGVIIRNISLQSAQGQQIANIQNVDSFLRCVSQALTSESDFETNDSNLSGATEADSYLKGSGHFFAASNAAVSNSEVAGAGAGCRLSVTATGNPIPSNRNYTEQNYVAAGTAAATEQKFPFVIPMSLFKESYLAYDKLDYLPSDMILSIDWASTDSLGYQLTTLGNHVDSTTLTGTHTITDLELRLSVESNNELASSKMSQVQAHGNRMYIPFITGVTNATGVGTSSSYSLPLNRAWGRSLLAIYTEVHNTSNVGTLAHDISNFNEAGTALGSKVLTQQTKFDNQNLQENVLQCTKLDDYKMMKNLLEGSVISNANIYNYNRVWIDSFRAGRCIDWSDLNNRGIIDGVSLEDRSKSWQISLTTPSVALMQRYFVVTQREMLVSPGTGLVSVV